MPNENQNPATPEVVLKGAITGGVEVAVNHPLWTLKTRYQDEKISKKDKRTFNPRILYRGVLPNMLSMMSITALQISSNAYLNGTSSSGFVNALSAGALSSVISGPTEFIISRQNPGQTFVSTAYQLYQQRGIREFTRGFVGTAIRDSTFAGGYLYGAQQLKELYSTYFSPGKAALLGGISAGTVAALVSQPADTLKTIQQTEAKQVTPLWSLVQNIYKNEGLKGFYRGGAPRVTRVISAVTIMSELTERFKKISLP